jgi:hypothetical protein
MPAKGMKLIISEYKILNEALEFYKKCLEKRSSIPNDEDKELECDEKLQDLEGLMNALKIAAKNDYDMAL